MRNSKAIALDIRRQQRKNEYLRLPHAKLVELLCDARYAIMRRNQSLRTRTAERDELQDTFDLMHHAEQPLRHNRIRLGVTPREGG